MAAPSAQQRTALFAPSDSQRCSGWPVGVHGLPPEQPSEQGHSANMLVMCPTSHVSCAQTDTLLCMQPVLWPTAIASSDARQRRAPATKQIACACCQPSMALFCSAPPKQPAPSPASPASDSPQTVGEAAAFGHSPVAACSCSHDLADLQHDARDDVRRFQEGGSVSSHC